MYTGEPEYVGTWGRVLTIFSDSFAKLIESFKDDCGKARLLLMLNLCITEKMRKYSWVIVGTCANAIGNT